MNPMYDLSHNVKTEIANTDDAKVIKIKATNVNVFYSEKQNQTPPLLIVKKKVYCVL